MFIVSELSENDESDGMDSDDSVCICSVGNSTSKGIMCNHYLPCNAYMIIKIVLFTLKIILFSTINIVKTEIYSFFCSFQNLNIVNSLC